MHSTRSQYEKIKEKLGARLQHAGADIIIRDVLAIEAPDLCGSNFGEFFTSDCNLIYVPSMPNVEDLDSLPHPNNAAYIFVRDKLYYKERNQHVLLPLNHLTLEEINNLKLELDIDINKPDKQFIKRLKRSHLQEIAKMVRHHHVDQKEHENDLITRMLKHIEKNAYVANQIHLEDNFAVDANACMKIKSDSVNNITRISFNEFSFYPSEIQGPLTETGLIHFVSKLEHLAKKLSPNLHILVSSIPIIDKNNDVHNVIYYVQCGRNPIIHTFAKACPSQSDLLYPGTANAFSSSGSEGTNLVREIIHFNSNYDSFPNLSFVEDFMWRCLHNPSYPPSPILVDKFDNHILKLRQGNLKPQDHSKFMASVNTHLNEFLIDIQELSNTYYSRTIDTPGNIPCITLTNESDTIGNRYGGHLTATTAGGEAFNIIIDICSDHLIGIGKEAFGKNILLAKETMEICSLPVSISQIITSAMVTPVPENIMSEDVTHTDVFRNRSGVIDTKTSRKAAIDNEYTFTETDFGNSTTIIVNKPMKLKKVSDKETEVISEHNQFSLKVQALKHLAVQQPQMSEYVHNELIQLFVYEATHRCERWCNARLSERQQIAKKVMNAFIGIKEIDHSHLHHLIEDMKDKVDTYLIESNKKYLLAKTALISFLKSFIFTNENDSCPYTLFSMLGVSNERERTDAAKILLNNLCNEQRIRLTKSQVAALVDKDSSLRTTLSQYVNDDGLLPKELIEAYKHKRVNANHHSQRFKL